MHTPWGPSQEAYPIGDSGIVFYSCAGHGGLKVPPALNAQIHETWRNSNGWYEEDCEYAIVAVSFPDIFEAYRPGTLDDYATGCAKSYFPDQYEVVFGVKVTAEESYIRAKQEFTKAHADKWVVVSAYGSWHEAVPEGMVGVAARLGGHDGPDPKATKYFLVPVEEYEAGGDGARGDFGFVIDPARHAEWDATVPATKRLG